MISWCRFNMKMKLNRLNEKLGVSIILPVFNEGENIEKQLLEIEKKLKVTHETLIVYDFDKDNTLPAAKKLQKKIAHLYLVKNMYGRGLISAVKTGFKKSHFETVVVMPADLADNPNTINHMYKKILAGFDEVVGGGCLSQARNVSEQ